MMMRYYSMFIAAFTNLSQRALQIMLGSIMLLLLTIVAWFAWTTQLAANSRTVADSRELKTMEILFETSEITSAAKDIETGQRGYLLTLEDSFLEPFNTGRRRLASHVSTLNTLVAESPEQRARLENLNTLLSDRTRNAERSLSMAQDGTITENIRLQLLRDGKNQMDSIRQLMARIVKHEQDALAINRSDANTASAMVDRFRTLFSIVGLVLVGLVGAAFWMLLRQRSDVLDQRIEMAAAKRVEQLLQDKNSDLEAQVERRTASLTDAVNNLEHEIAERESAETRLRHMEKMESIGKLTGGIAHDFNNMLAIIMGSLDMIRRRLPAGTEQPLRTALDNAQEGADRAASLTTRLLAYARQQPLAPRDEDVNLLIKDIAEVLSRTLGDDIELGLKLAPDAGHVQIDRPQLESALINLAVNARDAMPRGGKLTISTECADGFVAISVADTGTGMPPEIAAKVFDPFFTTKAVGKGTGLGLSQVHGFIAQSGGEISIISEPGRGTILTMILPAAEGEPHVPAPVPAEMAHLAQTRQACILLVEDEALVRLVAAETLSEYGHEVHMAADGKSALALLKAHPEIDLLLTDIAMPQMDGRELAERAREFKPSLKVLFTTGYDANGAGEDIAVLHKPYLDHELAKAVQDMINVAYQAQPDLANEATELPRGT